MSVRRLRWMCRVLAVGVLPGAAWAQTATGATQAGAASGQEQFRTAVADYDAGRFAEAATVLERLEPGAPGSFELHELLGMAYGGENRTEGAVRELKRAAELRPESPAARANLGTALVRAGDRAAGEEAFRAALALDGRNVAAAGNLARLLLGQNRVGEALPLLEQVHRAQPAARDVGYDLALAQLDTGHAEDARATVRGLMEQGDAAELHGLLGRVDEGEGKYVDAANEFAAAAHMDPTEENLFAWASELLLHRAYEQAIAVFGQGTGRYPKSARLWVGLGMANYSRGLYEPAVGALLTAADLDPRDARCYLFLSKAYLSSPTQADAVIARFKRYYELEPNNALAAYYAGMSLWKGKRVEAGEVDYKGVEALLRRSIALDGRDAEVHLQLGILLTDERAYDQALPEYERALALDPKLADAHFRLGRYYLHAGEKDKAERELAEFKTLQAEHQAELDKERAEVQQFVIAAPGGTEPKASVTGQGTNP